MSQINYKKILAVILSLAFFSLLGLSAFAYGPAASTIENPLGTNSVQGLLLKIMKLVMQVGSIVVVFFIIYSGYKFVTARGNPEEIKEAKNTFYATIIGGAILLGADIIANVVVNTVKATTGAR